MNAHTGISFIGGVSFVPFDCVVTGEISASEFGNCTEGITSVSEGNCCGYLLILYQGLTIK